MQKLQKKPRNEIFAKRIARPDYSIYRTPSGNNISSCTTMIYLRFSTSLSLRLHYFMTTMIFYYFSAIMHSLKKILLVTIHSFIYTFIHSFIYTFIHSFIYTYIHSYNYLCSGCYFISYPWKYYYSKIRAVFIHSSNLPFIVQLFMFIICFFTCSGCYYCTHCNITVNNEAQFEQHNLSKKHKQVLH